VAEASDRVPLLLYLRNATIGTAAIVELCQIENVAGVKWASPTPLGLSEAKRAAPDHIIWVCGLAEVWAPPLNSVGARGFTSGLINIWPERSVAIHSALAAGNFDAANELIAGMRVFEEIRAEEMGGTNVTAVKTALAMMGEDCGPVRAPSAWPLTEPQSKRLSAFLRSNDLIK
jgi:4-hydroxy-tetrahydrodipicolinate synthase